jgi:hypothetical protein
MKYVGFWWANNAIDLVEVGDSLYALYGWNGEKYTECWKCEGKYYLEASKERYELTPVYKCIGEDEYEVVDYEVSIV